MPEQGVPGTVGELRSQVAEIRQLLEQIDVAVAGLDDAESLPLDLRDRFGLLPSHPFLWFCEPA